MLPKNLALYNMKNYCTAGMRLWCIFYVALCALKAAFDKNSQKQTFFTSCNTNKCSL